MPEIDQLLSLMPTDVQVLIRAPHYAVAHNSRMYYQKLLVKKEVAPFIISACENGISEIEAKEAKLKVEIKELTDEIIKLNRKILNLETDKKVLQAKVDNFKENLDVFEKSTFAK